MKLELIGLTSLKCPSCNYYVYETNIRNYNSISYKCNSCGKWYYRDENDNLMQLILSYTPCFGTHGDSENREEICPLCLLPIKN